jgi:mRNA interferase MazF
MSTSDLPLATGAVVVVPFPYYDRLAEKRRPALVISGDAVHAAGYCWLLMITSAGQGALPDDVRITDLATTGLTAASVVRPIKIACVEPGRIIRVAGCVSDGDLAAVQLRFRGLCGLG